MPRGGWKYPTWSEKAIVAIGPPPSSARLRHLARRPFAAANLGTRETRSHRSLSLALDPPAFVRARAFV
jgi:hypothetical protein